MANESIFVDSVGAIIRVDVKLDLTNIDIHYINIKKPSGEIIKWDTTIHGNPEDGIMEYVTVKGDLNEVGIYLCNSRIEFENGEIAGKTFKFYVKEPFT